MKNKRNKAVGAGLLVGLLLGTSWVGAADTPPAIQLQIQDDQIQVVTDADAPSYYLEYRTPDTAWQIWNANMQVDTSEPLWFRAVFESGDIMVYEPPTGADTFYSPVASLDVTEDGQKVTTIGSLSSDGSILAMADKDAWFETTYSPPPAVQAVPDPANNQAYATPMLGSSQLIWRNTGNNAISRWDLADTTGDEFVIRAFDRFRLLPDLGTVDLNSSWVLGGIAALDNDLEANDYIWQNRISGAFSLWRVNEDPTIGEFGPIEYQSSPGVWENASLPAPWTVVGIASLSGDGKKNDVIWQNTSSGIISRWEVGDDGRISQYGRIQFYDTDTAAWVDADLPSPWTLGTIADLEGTGELNDFIWHNPSTGRFAYWKVNDSGQVTEFGPIQYETSPGVWENVELRSPWSIVGITELNGDGVLNDVIWHHPTQGVVSRWDVGADGRVTAFGRLQVELESVWQNVVLRSPWSMRGVVSVSGGGTLNNLVWHNPSTGRFACWRLSLSGTDTRITDFGAFSLNGSEVTLSSPWEITEARGN